MVINLKDDIFFSLVIRLAAKQPLDWRYLLLLSKSRGGRKSREGGLSDSDHACSQTAHWILIGYRKCKWRLPGFLFSWVLMGARRMLVIMGEVQSSDLCRHKKESV